MPYADFFATPSIITYLGPVVGANVARKQTNGKTNK